MAEEQAYKEDVFYEVQLAKHVPDFGGMEMSRLSPHHMNGQTLDRLVAEYPGCVASAEENDDLHPEKQMPDELDANTHTLTDVREKAPVNQPEVSKGKPVLIRARKPAPVR